MAYPQSNALPELSLSEKTREYKLYVDDLPQELNEDGIKEIFNHYGKIVALFYRCNATWAYISYDTYQEAESALKDLNEMPPLHLKVSFAKEKDTSNAYNIQKNLYDSEHFEEHNDNLMQKFSHSDESHTSVAGHGMPLNSTQPSSQVSMHGYTTDNDLVHPLPVNSYMHNPYENTRFFNSSNILWARGTVTVRQDGKQHVSFGRGHALYEIPIPHPKIEDNINKIYEKRITGLYKYGEESLKSKVGKCQYCSNVTKMTCGRCHIFYCSIACQKTDWQRHKVECPTIAALLKTVESTSLSRSNSVGEILAQGLSNAPLTRRKPEKFVKVHENENTNPRRAGTSRSTQNKKNWNRKSKKQIIPAKSKLPDAYTQSKTDLAFQNDTFLSKDKFTDIRIILAVGNQEYWVHKIQQESKVMSLMADLQRIANAGEDLPKEKLIEGDIYGVQYDGFWHRATLLSTDPVKIDYIDFGNEEKKVEKLNKNTFRDIGTLKDVARFARKIRFPKNTLYENLDIDNVLSVRMISVDQEKVISVSVQGHDDIQMLTSCDL